MLPLKLEGKPQKAKVSKIIQRRRTNEISTNKSYIFLGQIYHVPTEKKKISNKAKFDIFREEMGNIIRVIAEMTWYDKTNADQTSKQIV